MYIYIYPLKIMYGKEICNSQTFSVLVICLYLTTQIEKEINIHVDIFFMLKEIFFTIKLY